MEKKELSMPSPHVDDKKGKKAMIYKSEKGEGRKKEKKKILKSYH